jgi:hypothetical protein
MVITSIDTGTGWTAEDANLVSLRMTVTPSPTPTTDPPIQSTEADK